MVEALTTSWSEFGCNLQEPGSPWLVRWLSEWACWDLSKEDALGYSLLDIVGELASLSASVPKGILSYRWKRREQHTNSRLRSIWGWGKNRERERENTMVSSLTSSPSPLSVSVHLSPWSSKPATSSNGNASCDRCKPEMTRVVVTPPTSSSLRSLHQGLDRQCIHVGSSAQERRLIIPTHVLCSSSSTSSSPQARVSSRQDDSSSSPFMLLNVSYSSLGESMVWASWSTTNGSHLCPVRVSYHLSSQRGSEAEAQKQKDTVNFFCHASICLSKLLAMWIKRV